MKKIVIDTNVLMAGLIKDSIVRELLFTKKLNFYLPGYALDEIKKYEKDLLRKSGYSKKEFKIMINLLLENVKLVSKNQLQKYMKKAENIMRDIDIKDSSFVACALAIKAFGIWSFDKDFFKQKKVRALRIEDVARLIEEIKV
jgi:putative PIN family toxin of toxin-antitoxin system